MVKVFKRKNLGLAANIEKNIFYKENQSLDFDLTLLLKIKKGVETCGIIYKHFEINLLNWMVSNNTIIL